MTPPRARPLQPEGQAEEIPQTGTAAYRRAVVEAVVMPTPRVKATLFAPTPTRPTPAMGDQVPPPGTPARLQQGHEPQEQEPGHDKPDGHEGQGRQVGDGHLDGDGVGAEKEDRQEQRGLRQGRRPVLGAGHERGFYARIIRTQPSEGFDGHRLRQGSGCTTLPLQTASRKEAARWRGWASWASGSWVRPWQRTSAGRATNSWSTTAPGPRRRSSRGTGRTSPTHRGRSQRRATSSSPMLPARPKSKRSSPGRAAC
jgi:hypothetical protein